MSLRLRGRALPARLAVRFGRTVHTLFDVGIILKGINGVLEVTGGAALLTLTNSQVFALARFLTQHKLTEDPDALVATQILKLARHLTTSARVFGALWLLVHGVVKVGLVAALLLRRRWAYPAGIVVFLLFTAYQTWQYAESRSLPLLVLVLLDVAVVILTWLEYRRLQASGVFA